MDPRPASSATSGTYVFLHAVDTLWRDWLYFREHILVASVPRYRCYFLSGESIKAAENIEASDDVGALLEAENLLLRSDFLAIEVWQERKFIGRHSIAPDIKVIVGGKSNSSTSD